jgi:hypothetical protein
VESEGHRPTPDGGPDQLDALYESFDGFSSASDASAGEATSIASAAALAVHYADRLPEHRERQRLEFLAEEQAVARANGFRTGVFAVHQGHRPEAARSLDGFDADPGDETGRTRLVPVAELEKWYRSTWTFQLDRSR